MATSPRPYKNQATKNLESKNSFIRPKTMVRSTVIEGERKERMKRWVTFFRRNPNYLIRDYFGIYLHPFQIMMIWSLQRSTLAYIVAARAASKTFIIAIWALTLCVLYPGIKVITVSKTIRQGSLIIGKIDELRSNHPNVNREIESLTNNPNGSEVKFHCGSNIKSVPCSESARGNRANYIIIEESRLVPKEILESVIKPFLEVRNPPYMSKPEYRDDVTLREDATISYITSAWYSSEYWYTYVKSCIKRVCEGDETANFLAFDHLVVLKSGIKTEKMLKDEMADTDEITVQMEYYNIPSGSSGKSYFPSRLFTRNIKKAFYPQRAETYNSKKNKYAIPKEEGEIRIVTVDVATRANKVNDNSIIGCIRMIPIIGEGYERHLSYMESHKGQHVGIQAQRIKEIFYDFESDYICLDLASAGIGIFDSLSEPTLCEERGITFPAMTVVDEFFDIIKQDVRDELRNNHTRGVNALPIIFPIQASQALNSQIATYFRSSLQKKLWRFLIVDGDAEEHLIKTIKEFTKDSNDSETSAFYLHPYIQTGLFIGECINLDMTLVSGLIKLTEKPGCYKDRYSCVSYANYIISSQFDKTLLKENDDTDDFSEVAALIQTA